MKEVFVVKGLDTLEKKQEAEKILKQLGYTNAWSWNEKHRTRDIYTFISIQKSGRYEYHRHPCVPKPLITLNELKSKVMNNVEEHNAEIIELPSDDKVTWTREQFIELRNIACNSWKDRLTDMFKGFAIQDELEVSKEVYETMRDACTASQRKVFDKIFGEDPFKEEVYFKCTKSLEDRFVKGKKYRLIKIMNNDYFLENEFGREHRVSIGYWADYFYKID